MHTWSVIRHSSFDYETYAEYEDKFTFYATSWMVCYFIDFWT
jgi:hypothetical protein